MSWAPAAVALAAVCLIALVTYARRVEHRSIVVSRHDLLCPGLAPELDGLTICQVSDVHVADELRHEGYVAEALRSVHADLYVLTGDMVCGHAGIRRFMRWVDGLGPALRPAVAVPGNAEHKPSVRLSEVREGLAQRGVPLLVNESLRWPSGGAYIQIVGVDDPHTNHSDFDVAYRNADPHLWTLVLCHSPDGVADIGARRADLVLCGHTHGGQVRLPLVGALHAHTRRVRGLVAGLYEGDALSRSLGRDAGAMRVYVSRGLGRSGVPYRLLCRPELPVFTLRRG